MSFGRSLPQRRIVVFFRPLLAVPQLVVLYFLNIAALVLVVLGWFAALFTGRLPESAASFLIGNLRWRARVDAYLFLLTDRYPPFSLDRVPDYPADMAVQTGRLNRWSVLFRYFLAIPALFAVALLAFGVGIFWIVTWVAALIKGEVPRALFEANAAALRYEYRFAAFFFMLTSFYPAEVMGDAAPTPGTVARPTPVPPPVVPSSVPFGGPADPGVQSSVPPPPLPPPQPPMPGPGPRPDAAPAPVPGAAPPPPSVPPSPYPSLAPDIGLSSSDRWRLVLSPAARRLVVTYFIVGALGLVAYVGVLVAVTSHGASTTTQAISAQNELITAYNLVGQQSQSFAATTRGCASSQGTAASECLAAADGQLASDLQAYQHAVSSIDFPTQVIPQVAAVTAASAAASGKLEQLSQLGSNPQTYSAAANSSDLATAFDRVDSATRTLNSALLNL
jgi:hypothetical protein